MKLTSQRLKDLFAKFKSHKIIVVGDLMLDEFIWGKVIRISPEAPVPVVEVVKEESYPGGAANVARNLRALGAQVEMIGQVGKDAYATQLQELLKADQIGISGVLTNPASRTIVKTRVIARHQQVVRVDREKRERLPVQISDKAVAEIKTKLRDSCAVIVEDYGKGFLTQILADRISNLASTQKKILAIDPNPYNPLLWNEPTVVKPNRSEAFAAAGVAHGEAVRPVEKDEALERVGKILLEKWRPQQLLITLGEDGMGLFQKGKNFYHTPTRAQDVFDVTGAGDTVISVYTLCLASGATPVEAAEIANHAAGIVVGKLGTATATPAEIIESFNHHGK
ncbi:MAG: D-glycero-beta-D-manno-heptose-7-phosphate kinase [Verrucomicrobiae bacterium]|nr:D-glycero-beta-D-manno-heptose-7-phosphate kinase [Verrucomicrobiae bacterium]